MTQMQQDNFDDPGLKAALCRIWGQERAPEALRQRMIGLLPEQSDNQRRAAQSAPAIWRFRSPLMGLAAAAVVLLALGIVFHDRIGSSRGSAILPEPLAAALVARHDGCCEAPDHHMPGLASDLNDFSQLRQGLHGRLGIPVISAGLPAGWHFHGASICPVGTGATATNSGHLVFDRNRNQFVSIFSLPRTMRDGTHVRASSAQVALNHPIAGFVTADGFYCIVGSSTDGSLTLPEVRQFRDDMEPNVALIDQAIRAVLADTP